MWTPIFRRLSFVPIFSADRGATAWSQVQFHDNQFTWTAEFLAMDLVISLLKVGI
jgi:hypothetical protein